MSPVYGNALGELLGLLIAAPFVALADWFKFIKYLPPGQQELTKACHGMGMAALVVYLIQLTGGFDDFVRGLAAHSGEPLRWIPVGIAAWGLGWFLLNARFASQAIAPPHRTTMMVRGLIKLTVGYAVWAYADDSGSGIVAVVLNTVAFWCMATGGTKVLLMLWGSPRGQAYPMVTRNIAANEFDWDR